MAPRQDSRWCCSSGDDAKDECDLNARHPILARQSRRGLRYMPSSLESGNYGNSDIELSGMTTQTLSEDDDILPDPRTLGGGNSPSTGSITRPFTPTGVARLLRSKLSRDSTQFRVKRQHKKLQKKSLLNFHQKDSTISLNDLVGLHSATRAPSRGGYDVDAQTLTDSDLLARLDMCDDAERGRSRTAVPIRTPPKQIAPRARMPHVKYTAFQGSPLIKVQRASSVGESSEVTVPRTSTSTYTTGSLGTPVTTEDNTETLATVTISSIDTTDVFATRPADELVERSNNEAYQDLSSEKLQTFPRLSLKDFSQSSLHLTSSLAKPESSLMQIPELAASSSFNPGTVELDTQAAAVPRVPTPHLYDMRISQHLRSLSSFSEDDLGQSQPGSYQSSFLPYQIEAMPPKREQETMVRTKPNSTGLLVPRVDNTRSSGIQTRELATTSEEESKDKDSNVRTSVSWARADSASVMYDGQSDQHLGVPATQRRSSSVSDNYEDTAAVWQKALNGYQFEKAMKDKKRKSNSVKSSGSPMRRSRATSVESAGHELDPLEPESSRLPSVAELRPIDTEHTFSHLHRPGQEVESLSESSKQSADDFFHAFNRVTTERARALTHASSTVGPLDEKLDVPNITLTRPERSSQMPVPTTPTQKRPLTAWARFPSEDREERNGAAGAADHVITRDFAPISPSKSDAGDSEVGASGQKKKKKSMISRTKAIMMKRKNELPLLFRTRTHEAQGGHRSSIAPGGGLEYPELEMLPGADIHELTPMDAWKHAIESAPAPQRTHSIDDRAPEDDDTTMTKASLIGSSDYGSAPGSPPRSVSTTRRRMLQSKDDQHQYLTANPETKRRPSDEISPLDGMSIEIISGSSTEAYGSKSMLGRDSPHKSPGSKSLPPTLHRKMVGTPTQHGKTADILKIEALSKIASTEGLRRSTQDLNRMLEETSVLEAEKALRAAESWAL